MITNHTDMTWDCKVCGATNAGYRDTCGRCEYEEERKKNNPKKNLIQILETLREDFEMLEDGRWDLTYSDGSEIQESIQNIERAIRIVKNNFYE